MSAMPTAGRSVEVFLGPDAGQGGPFALLDLDPQRADAPTITAALDRRLALIARHPQGQTPAADEVRLALHAAAAQLMDPSVRESMRARFAGRAPSTRAPDAPTPVTTGPSEPVSPARPPAPPRTHDLRFEGEARAILASMGGPGPQAMIRLAALARARGIPPEQVPAVVRSLGSGAASAAPSAVTPAASPMVATRPVRPEPRSFVSTSATGGETVTSPVTLSDPFAFRERDDSARAIKTVASLALVGLLLMVGAFWAVIVLTTPKGPAPAVVREPETLTGHMAEPDLPDALFPRATDATTPPQAQTPDRPEVDSESLLNDFRALVSAQGVDPQGAAASFGGFIHRAGADWPDIPLDRRRAIVDLVVQYVYQASAGAQGPAPALEIVAAGAARLASNRVLTAEGVGQASWSVGLLVRLQRERDISARAGSLIEARLGAALQGIQPVGASAFDAGAIAALGAMPARLLPAADQPATREFTQQRLAAWQRWLEAIDAATGSDTAARQGLILGGLDVLLRDASEPTDDRAVFESIALLIESLDFAEGSPTRAWLVRTLDAPGVSTGDAHAMLNAIATRVPEARLDVSLVIAPAATDLQRKEARDRLAILWNLADPVDRDELASAWREAWQNALDRRESDLTPFEHLASAVVLSRVSEAAMLRWRGLTEEAQGLLQVLEDDIDPILSPASAPGSGADLSTAGDGAWADQYLQAGRSIPIRLDLLQSMSRSASTSIGPVDAEVLLSEAIRGSPPPVATAAHDIVVRLGASPAVVMALLEELPVIAKTKRNATLISALTGARLPITRDQRWEVEARRATVTRLLELMAADGEMRVYDDLSSLLAQSYVVRNQSRQSDGLAGSPGRQVDPPEFAAGVLRSMWRRQAEALMPPPSLGLSLDEIDRRRASRLELAEGPVQTFAAEQLAAVEIMALVVASEQPEQVAAVRQILDDLARARQRARHITEQIAAGEAAAAGLWGVRLKEGGVP